MAKLIKYDNTGVEESAGGTGVKVRPGVKVARIAKCQQRGPGFEVENKRDGSPANDIEVALDCGPEYDWVFTYIGLSDASDWKLAEFTRALGMKDKGSFDPAKQVGKIIRVKINSGEYEGEYSPTAGKLFPPQPGDEVGAASETSNKTTGPDDEDSEPEPEVAADGFYREGQPDPEDPNETVGSYDDWEEEDLLAEIEDRGLTMPGGRGAKTAKAIKALREDDAAQEGPEDEPEDGAAGDDDEYESMSLEDLQAEWNDRELGDQPKVRGSNAEARLKAKLIEGLRADDGDDPFAA